MDFLMAFGQPSFKTPAKHIPMKDLHAQAVITITGGTSDDGLEKGLEVGYLIGNWVGTKVGEAIDVTFYLMKGFGSFFN
ncbi:hypothetical protein [Neolewinella litorea]|uniref:Uncharacterized protein n=1 Tax=Neolewinella litorea TaxID=2562452 RepID=A0A4S4NPT8_9BACT|nr:hypothetical protein [Neolewinella litorea]THH42079.1 hypothetical protein E4021_05720 [Neolewinella litorea]